MSMALVSNQLTVRTQIQRSHLHGSHRETKNRRCETVPRATRLLARVVGRIVKTREEEKNQIEPSDEAAGAAVPSKRQAL
jgi:hypothetical protein